MIRSTIAGNGQPHQAGPLVFSFAHARSHTSIRSIFQFVTPSPNYHELVIQIERPGIARSGSGIATSAFAARLITPIDPADTRPMALKGFRKGAGANGPYPESQIGLAAPSFETAAEPVTGRAFARPFGGLLRMRSKVLKQNNLMPARAQLRSSLEERTSRLEAWATSDFSHSQY
jgi:hypothetical protein